MKVAILCMWNAFVMSEGKEIVDKLKKFPIVMCKRLRVTYYDGL